MASQRQAVAPMVDRIVHAASAAGLSPTQRDNLAVAVAEALANAAVHGNNLRAQRQVRVTVSVRPGVSAEIEVKDSGAGFDVEGLNDPTEPAHVLATGGRGVFLMRRLVDDVSYNAAGNEVRLTVRNHGSGRDQA
jgi:anti-sigma regulatory factor (Ser/Thr protein kinase)